MEKIKLIRLILLPLSTSIIILGDLQDAFQFALDDILPNEVNKDTLRNVISVDFRNKKKKSDTVA